MATSETDRVPAEGRSTRLLRELIVGGSMAFTGNQVWQMRDLVAESTLDAIAMTVVAAIAPTIIGHMSGQQWNAGGGIRRLTPVMFTLVAIAFAAGVALHRTDVGLPHPWLAGVVFTFIASIGPAVTFLHARERAAG